MSKIKIVEVTPGCEIQLGSFGETFKSGMTADIPYIRVWQDDVLVAEFCQHNIVGVYYK